MMIKKATVERWLDLMLTKETFSFKMNELLMAFPNWKIDNNDPETMRFWYYQLKDMSGDRFVAMVDQYINNEQYNATIGGLKQYDTLPRKTRDQIEHEKMLREMQHEHS